MIGTSWDGLGLAKGNNEFFTSFYPVQPGNLDDIIPLLMPTKAFASEWQYDDFFGDRAKQYVVAHPVATLRADLSKVNVMLFTVKRGFSNGGRLTAAGRIASLLVLRLLQWAALLIAGYGMWTNCGIGRRKSLIYLVAVAAYLAPFILCYGVLRPAFIQLYPAVLICALAIGTLRLPADPALTDL